MRHLPLIDDPDSGEMAVRRETSIQRLGGAESIPFSAKERKSFHDADWDESYDELLSDQYRRLRRL